MTSSGLVSRPAGLAGRRVVAALACLIGLPAASGAAEGLAESAINSTRPPADVCEGDLCGVNHNQVLV
jgi:hypothetical protein